MSRKITENLLSDNVRGTLENISETYGMFAITEIEKLVKVVRELPDDPVAVVLGAACGTASITMLASRPDITVFSIDIIDAWIERFHATNKNYMPRLHQIRGCSYEIEWDETSIDLLFVDACHAYECVKKDNAMWLRYLKDGGIAWYHDYGETNSMYLDVKRAVDEDMIGQEQIIRTCSSIAFRWRPQ